jgi:hypothetical protein
MDAELERRWREAASAIYFALDAREYKDRSSNRRHARRQESRVALALDFAVEHFGTATPADWRVDFRNLAARRDGWWGAGRPEADVRLKALLLGLGVAAGDTASIARHEGRFVAEALASLPWASKAVAALRRRNRAAEIKVAPGQTVVIEAVHGWTRGGADATSMAKALVGVTGVDPAETSVAFRLLGGDGEWMDVRRLGASLYRPLLSPGSWRGIGVGEFVEAAKGAAPWGDSPLAENRRALMALADHASDEPPETRGHRKALAAAAERVRLACSGLVSVDGVVHKPVSSVSLDFDVNRAHDGAPAPSAAWATHGPGDGLSSNEPQGTACNLWENGERTRTFAPRLTLDIGAVGVIRSSGLGWNCDVVADGDAPLPAPSAMDWIGTLSSLATLADQLVAARRRWEAERVARGYGPRPVPLEALASRLRPALDAARMALPPTSSSANTEEAVRSLIAASCAAEGIRKIQGPEDHVAHATAVVAEAFARRIPAMARSGDPDAEPAPPTAELDPDDAEALGSMSAFSLGP